MKRTRALPILPLCFLLLLLYFANGQAAPTSNLRIAYINVGQGDAALIRDSSGFDILIDGGKTSAGPVVVAYLRGQGIDDVDVMVASHADSDHIGGLIDVLETADIPVEAVLYNGYPGSTDTWNNFVTAVTNEGLSLTTLQYPSTSTWGETTAHILNPVAGLVNPETNDVSVVIMLEHGDNHFLFTGDIDSGVEGEILEHGEPVAADVLKVAHHGSQYSSSEAFLLAVLPDNAVISVGDNPYGHPADETLARLAAVGAHIWRTDLDGTIVVDSDGFSYSIYSEYRRFRLYLPLVTSNLQAATTTENVK